MIGVQHGDALLWLGGNVENIDAEVVGREVEKVRVRLADAAHRERLAEVEHAQQPAARQLDLVDLAIVGRQVRQLIDDERQAQAVGPHVILPYLNAVGVEGRHRLGVGRQHQNALRDADCRRHAHRQIGRIDADAHGPFRLAVGAIERVEDAAHHGQYDRIVGRRRAQTASQQRIDE